MINTEIILLLSMASTNYLRSIFFLLLIITFNFLIRVSISKENCPSTRPCNSSDSTVSVKFPFRVAEYQSNIRCSYNSSFDLSCNPKRQTILNISNVGPFAIYNIDYSSQEVVLTDPDGCLPQRFLNFNLSASPFYSTYIQNNTYYSCTSLEAGSILYRYEEPCMSRKNYTVIVFRYGIIFEKEIRKNNCTFIKNVSSPYYISSSYFYYYYNNYNYSNKDSILGNRAFRLGWAEPLCKYCVTSGIPCGFKGVTNLTECQADVYNPGNPSPRASNSSNSADGIVLILYLVVIILPGMLIIMCVLARVCRSGSENHQAINLTQTQMATSTQQSTTTATTGLPETAIESNPLFVLGEGDVLLEPNVSPCAICLSEYKAGDALRTILECNHFFHSHCVDEWLKLKGTCPLCRKGGT